MQTSYDMLNLLKQENVKPYGVNTSILKFKLQETCPESSLIAVLEDLRYESFQELYELIEDLPNLLHTVLYFQLDGRTLDELTPSYSCNYLKRKNNLPKYLDRKQSSEPRETGEYFISINRYKTVFNLVMPEVFEWVRMKLRNVPNLKYNYSRLKEKLAKQTHNDLTEGSIESSYFQIYEFGKKLYQEFKSITDSALLGNEYSRHIKKSAKNRSRNLTTYRIFSKKLTIINSYTNESEECIEIIILEKRNSSSFKKIFKKQIPCNSDQKTKAELKGFLDFELAMTKKGDLELLELNENVNLELYLENDLHFPNSISTKGWIDIKKTTGIRNNAHLKFETGLFCNSPSLINRGKMGSHLVQILGTQDFTLCTLYNQYGEIFGRNLDFHLKSCNNQQGKIVADIIRLRIDQDLLNQKGNIFINEMGAFYIVEHLKNQRGAIFSNSGHIKIVSFNGIIDCRNSGRIQTGYLKTISKPENNNQLRILSDYILTDETSLIHGSQKAFVKCRENIRQESILSSKNLILCSNKNLNITNSLLATKELIITAPKALFVIHKDFQCNKKIFLNTAGSDIRGKLIAPDIILNLSKALKYSEDVFKASNSFNLVLSTGQAFNTKLSVPGSTSIHILNNLNKLIFNADIIVGQRNSQILSNLFILAQGVTFVIGSNPENYVTLYANGNFFAEQTSCIVNNGRIIGMNGLSLSASENIHIGNLNRKVSEKPSGLLSNRFICIHGTKEVLLEKSTVTSNEFLYCASLNGKVQIVSSIVQALENAVFDAPLTQIHIASLKDIIQRRTSYYDGCAHDAYRIITESVVPLGGPSQVFVGKNLMVSKDFDILGSLVKCQSYTGQAPKIANFISYYNYTNRSLCGHKKISKCQWHENSGSQIESISKAVLSSNDKLTLSNPMNVLGFVFSGEDIIFSDINNTTVGITANISLPPPHPFKLLFSLNDYLTSNAAYEFSNSEGNPILASILSSPYNWILPEPVILNSAGFLEANNNKLLPLFSAELESHALISFLLKEFCRGFLDQDSTTPLKMICKLRENAHKMLHAEQDKTKQSTIISLSQKRSWIDRLEEPLLVYKISDFEGKSRLSPHLLVPNSWNNSKLRDHAGGIFSFNNIIFQGQSRNSKFKNLAHLYAPRGKISFTHFDEVVCEKRTYRKSVQVLQSFTSGNVFREKTKIMSTIVNTSTPESGGTITAGQGIIIDNTKKSTFVGAELNAGKPGIHITSNIFEEFPVIRTSIIESNSSGNSRLKYVTIKEQLPQSELIPTHFQSDGSITIMAEDQRLTSLQAKAAESITSESNRFYASGSKIEQQLPTQVKAKPSSVQISSVTTEVGLPVRLHSENSDVKIKTDNLYSQGSEISAKKDIYCHAKNNFHSDILSLTTTINAKISGKKGFTLFNSKTNQTHIRGIQPKFISGKNIEFQVDNGPLILIAPLLLAIEKVNLTSTNGSLTILPAVFHHDVTIEQNTIGMSFFASEAILAAMKGDFKQAALNILREFPLLRDLENLAKSKDTADFIGNGILTLLSIYKTYKAFSEAASFKDFIKGQINPEVKFRFTKGRECMHWEELALPWMQARELNLSGKHIESLGLIANCEDMTVHSKTDANFGAKEVHSSSSSKTTGKGLGINCLTLAPSLSFDYSSTNKRAINYIHSHLNILNKFTMQAGNTISMRGVFVETCKAVLQAENLHLETLQDTSHSNMKSFGLGTAGQLSFSYGHSERKFVNEQSGIHARKSFLACIQNEVNLLGAVIKVDDNNKSPANNNQSLISASKIIGHDILDREKNKSFGFGFTGGIKKLFDPLLGISDLDLRNSKKERINHAAISPNIQIQTSTVSGIERDINNTQTQIKNEKHHWRFVVPIVRRFPDKQNRPEIQPPMRQRLNSDSTSSKSLTLQYQAKIRQHHSLKKMALSKGQHREMHSSNQSNISDPALKVESEPSSAQQQGIVSIFLNNQKLNNKSPIDSSIRFKKRCQNSDFFIQSAYADTTSDKIDYNSTQISYPDVSAIARITSSIKYPSEPNDDNIPQAVFTGVMNGIKGTVECIIHPWDNMISPMIDLINDINIISEEHEKEFEYEIYSVNKDPSIYWNAKKRMQSRIDNLNNSYIYVKNAPYLKKVELGSEFLTNIILPNGLLKAGKFVKNLVL